MKKKYDPSARLSILGFKYQDLYALYLLYTKNVDNENYITYESEDDIVFYNGNKEILYQIKYKSSKERLTDSSHDFWATMRNWCFRIKNKEIKDISNTEFILVTTEKIAKNSIK